MIIRSESKETLVSFGLPGFFRARTLVLVIPNGACDTKFIDRFSVSLSACKVVYLPKGPAINFAEVVSTLQHDPSAASI